MADWRMVENRQAVTNASCTDLVPVIETMTVRDARPTSSGVTVHIPLINGTLPLGPNLLVPIEVLAARYGLDKYNIQDKLTNYGYKTTGSLCDVTREELARIGLRSGDIATLRIAMQLWVASLEE